MLPERQHQHYPRIPRMSYITLFQLRISLPFYLIAYTFLIYIYHLISIDLQLSHSCNSPHCKAYSYEPGSHCLLSNYLNRTTCYTINLLPHSRSHYFYHLCKCFKPLPGTALVLIITFTYQTNGRATLTDDHTRPTNELMN
jgi:hypothetical protein